MTNHLAMSLKGGQAQKRKRRCIMVRHTVLIPRFPHTLTVYRTSTQRTLGPSVLDLARSLRRICQNPRRKQRPILEQNVLPPNVPMEQRRLLQTSRSRTHSILLARRAQSPLLLRRRLRRFPIHARPQQNLRIQHQPLRLTRIHPLPLARDNQIPRRASRIHT